MAHVEDQWKYPDGTSRPRDGQGKRYRVRYVDPEGKEHSKSFERKTDASAFEKTTAADLLRGQYTDEKSGKITLREFIEGPDGWLARQTFEPTTRESNEMRLRVHVLPPLGSVPLAKITSARVQTWVTKLGVAPSTARVTLSLLSAILGTAVEDKLIATNPCSARSVRSPKIAKRHVVPWSRDEVAAIRSSLPAHFAAMCDLGAGLGLRQGEILGLAVDDINFHRREVHVRRQVVILNGKLHFSPLKSREERFVPMAKAVEDALTEHILMHGTEVVTLPVPGARPESAKLLFTSNGKPLNRHRLNPIWRKAVETAGVTVGREHGMHALRHTFASAALANGVDIRSLASYLGHKDAGFTLRVYAHLMPGADDRLRLAIDLAYTQEQDHPSDVTATSRESGNPS